MNARQAWLDHLDVEGCTLCPALRCPKGDELAAAVREIMDPDEVWWEGIYRQRPSEHGPARMIRDHRLHLAPDRLERPV